MTDKEIIELFTRHSDRERTHERHGATLLEFRLFPLINAVRAVIAETQRSSSGARSDEKEAGGTPAEPPPEALDLAIWRGLAGHDISLSKRKKIAAEINAGVRAALANERRGSPEEQMGYPTARSGESARRAAIQDRADAERYRWLRLRKHADIGMCWFLPTEAPFNAPSLPAEIDAAIDAARKEPKT